MMNAIRDEIRAILREELAALRAGPGTAPPMVESVPVASGADLTRFACDLLARASDPSFVERVKSGALRFEPSAPPPTAFAPYPAPGYAPSPGYASALVAGPANGTAPPGKPAVVDKSLVTERDLAALAKGQRHLRISHKSRLTPLARDEARRLGIRIERCEP